MYLELIEGVSLSVGLGVTIAGIVAGSMRYFINKAVQPIADDINEMKKGGEDRKKENIMLLTVTSELAKGHKNHSEYLEILTRSQIENVQPNGNLKKVRDENCGTLAELEKWEKEKTDYLLGRIQ